MQVLIIITILLFIVGAVLVGGYLLYRRGLRYAKGIERGIKMVPILINLPPPSEDVEVGGRDVRDVIQERISQAEVLYNLIASTATKGFKSKFFGQRHIGFELVAVNGVIQFYAAVPVAMVEVIKQAVLTAYPGANLEEVEDHNIFSQTGKISGTYGGELVLKQDYPYPIATFDQLKRNTMEGIINSLTSLEEGDGAGIQILLRPAREEWAKNAESLAKDKREDSGGSGFSFKHILQAPFKVPEGGDDKDEGGKQPKQLSNLEQTAADAIEEKAKSTGYEVLIRVVASSGTASRAQVITNNIVSSFSLFDAQGLNGFSFQPAKNIEQFVTDYIFRFFPPERKKMILNSVELSTIFHLPDAQFTQTSQVQRQYSKQVEGPSQLSREGLLIGYNIYRGVKKQIRISDNDRRRHVYIVGQTGTGKSVLLENMMVQDMRAGKGFAFIDPHGDAAEKVLGIIPQERSEDVIYFDPGEMDHPPGLNLFEYHTEDQKDFLIQETLNMLYKLYDPQQQGIIGPRYEHMFRNAALTVMADPNGGTFIDIPKLFRDSQFVKEKLKYVEDKTVQEFWQKEIPQAQRSSDFGEMMSWFVSKFGAFLSNQMMRNIIGQPKSSFDLREVMDSRKILIANLSKGRLGELNSMLLGMIFVMKFQAAAMSRANQPEDERIDFSFYIDEFQNFSTDSFAFILSEARKYHLNMIVANQFISQLSEEIREAVFGNVGTIVSLRTGPNDADFLVKQFSPTFNDRDLVNLPNYHAAVRLMSQGLPTQPFNMVTLPPLGDSNPELAKALKRLSNLKYGRPRQEVEDEIFDRLSTKPPPSPYEGLASSQSEASASGASEAKSQSGQQSGSSFLDEWLAKRRSAMGSNRGSGPASPTASGSATPPGAATQQNKSPGGAGTAGTPPDASSGQVTSQRKRMRPRDGQSGSDTQQRATSGQPGGQQSSRQQPLSSGGWYGNRTDNTQQNMHNMPEEGNMTSKQPNNPEENEQQQANASDSPYQPPAHSQQPGTSGGVQDGQSQAGSQNQYAQQPSGVSSQTPPSGDDNVSQAADQATPGGVSAEDNQSASDTPRSGDQTSRPAKQPGSTETVVQPPEDDERQSVREELLSAINSDETDTWVGSKDEDTQSNAVQQPDNAVSGQQQASQQPAEQPPDTAQTTSDTPQTQDGAVQGGAQTFPQSAADTTGSSQENQPVPPPPDQTGSQQVSDETQQPGSGSQEPTPEPQQPPAGQLEPATPEAQSGLQAASSQQENTEAAPPETVNSQEPVSQAESTPQQPAAEPQQPQKGGQDEGIDPGDTVAPDQTSQVAADGTQPPAESSGPAPASSASPASNQNVQNEAVQPGTDENVQQNGPDQTTPPETQTPVQSAPQQGGNALDVAQSNQQTDQAAEQPSEQAVAGEGVQNQSQPEASETPQPKPGEVYIDEEGNVHRG